MSFLGNLLGDLLGVASNYAEDVNKRRVKYSNYGDDELINRVKHSSGKEKIAAAMELKSRKES